MALARPREHCRAQPLVPNTQRLHPATLSSISPNSASCPQPRIASLTPAPPPRAASRVPAPLSHTQRHPKHPARALCPTTVPLPFFHPVLSPSLSSPSWCPSVQLGLSTAPFPCDPADLLLVGPSYSLRCLHHAGNVPPWGCAVSSPHVSAALLGAPRCPQGTLVLLGHCTQRCHLQMKPPHRHSQGDPGVQATADPLQEGDWFGDCPLHSPYSCPSPSPLSA